MEEKNRLEENLRDQELAKITAECGKDECHENKVKKLKSKLQGMIDRNSIIESEEHSTVEKF